MCPLWHVVFEWVWRSELRFELMGTTYWLCYAQLLHLYVSGTTRGANHLKTFLKVVSNSTVHPLTVQLL